MNYIKYIEYNEVVFYEFKRYIESIGFKRNGIYYVYKEYRLYLLSNYYNFNNGSLWVQDIDLNDLRPFKVFKKELRSIKLKQLLG